MNVFAAKLAELRGKKDLTPHERAALESCDPEDIARVCDDTGVPHPTIISESGRALVAHHSMLVFNVLGVSGLGEQKRADAESGGRFLPERLPADAPQPLIALLETCRDLGVRNALESWHDAQQSLDMAMHLFNGGYLFEVAH